MLKYLFLIFTVISLSACSNNTLEQGEIFYTDDCLISDNRKFKLTLRKDGDLVLFGEGYNKIWATNTMGSPVRKCIMQEDGNLVLYDDLFKSYWSSNTKGTKGVYIKLENSGDIVLYKNGHPFYSINNETHFGKKKSTLISMEKLLPGQYLLSPNRKYKLLFKKTGSIVLYGKRNLPIWQTNTKGKPAAQFILQEDGNLVLYDKVFNHLWSSNTHGIKDVVLKLQNDGNLVIYNKNKPIWASNTASK